jgi:protein SCO1
MLDRVENYFTSWQFPVFMLYTLLLSWIFIVIMAFVPVTDSAWGAFAEDFKVWCFGYDPATGKMQWIYLIMFTVNPLILALVILFVWQEPLQKVWNAFSITRNQFSLSSILVIAVIASFLMMFEVPEENLEFQPDVLRTSHTAPEFTLINQHNEEVSLADFEGRVVILTSVYASCADTCPMILEQARNVLDTLTARQQEDVVLLAITMQPEKDTPELLSQVARFYRLDNYNAHLLTGDPGKINALLDRLNVSRYERADSADLDHANLFMILDREGSIAYRFTIGKIQQQWMAEALKLLVDEPKPERLTDASGH